MYYRNYSCSFVDDGFRNIDATAGYDRKIESLKRQIESAKE